MDITIDPGGPHSPEYSAALANAIAEAVRALNHGTIDRRNGALAYPADADAVIRAIATAAERLPQLLTQLREWLEDEYAEGRVQVTYGPLAGDAEHAIAVVDVRLLDAAAAAGQLHSALKDAAAVTSTISASNAGSEEG